MQNKRFFVLPYSLPSEHIPHLMGRIVLDPLNPLRSFIPDPDDDAAGGFNPEDIVPTLRREPFVYHDCTEVVRAGTNTRLRARLSDFLGLEAGASTSDSAELRASVVRRYNMVNHVSVFRRFMAHDAFRGLIEGILDAGKGGEALMIVGFYTAQRTRWVRSRRSGREHGVDVQVPVGAFVGVPVSVDPGIGVSVAAEAEHAMTREVEAEEIFAIAYDVVKKKHSLDRTAKRWVSSTPVLGDEKRVQAGHLAMGRGSEDELEYESEPESEGADAGCVLDGGAREWEPWTGKFLDYIDL